MRWFKSFKMCETTYSQIKSLPEKMQLKFYDAVCDYGLNGIEHDFSGMERTIWIPMKDLIDSSIKRSKINSNNGKNGGAPEGNQNAKQAKTTENNHNQPNVADIIDEASTNGFCIDEGTAKDFLSIDGVDPHWLNGSYSFIKFAAEKIKEKYNGKSNGDRKVLFISAIKTWDDLRAEYPDWKSKKEEKDEAAVKARELDEAQNKHPTKCNHCGEKLAEYKGNYHCRSCGIVCELSETLEWEWKKY